MKYLWVTIAILLMSATTFASGGNGDCVSWWCTLQPPPPKPLYYNSCTDLHTLRKTYLKSRLAFKDFPCANEEVCLSVAQLKSLPFFEKITATEITKILPEPACVAVQDTTLCSSDPHHKIVKLTIDGKTHELPILCDEGLLCQLGQCVSQTAALCKDSDKTIVANNKPDWNSIITPGNVTAATGEVKPDMCKDDSFLQEQYCDAVTGKPKMVYVGCKGIDPSGKCTDAKCIFGTLTNDKDKDGIPDAVDNCPLKHNPDQSDGDNDGLGNPCDNCPVISNSDQQDGDKDAVGDVCDNCPQLSNAFQLDYDNDGVGNDCSCMAINFTFPTPAYTPELWAKCSAYVCDDPSIPCSWPKWWVPGNIGANEDSNGDGISNSIEDDDGDGIPNSIEECVIHTNPLKKDSDLDGVPDDQELGWQSKTLSAFEGGVHHAHLETDPLHADTDQDGIVDGKDACPLNPDYNCTPATCIPPKTPAKECAAQLMYSAPVPTSVSSPNGIMERVAWAAGSPNIVAITQSYPILDNLKGLKEYSTQIHQSSDGGKTWDVATHTNTGLVLNKTKPISLSADGKERRLGMMQGLYESHDFGKTWVAGYYGKPSYSPEPIGGATTLMQWVSPDGTVEYAVGKTGAFSKRTLPNGQWQWIVNPEKQECLNGKCITWSSTDVVVGDASGSHLVFGTLGNIIYPPVIGPAVQYVMSNKLAMSLTGENAFEVRTINAGGLDAVLYSTTQGKIWQYSTQSDQIIHEIPSTLGNASASVAISPDGKTAYVLNYYDTLWQAKAATTGKVSLGEKWEPVFGGSNNNISIDLRDIAVSPDGKEVIAVGTQIKNVGVVHNVIYKFTCP